MEPKLFIATKAFIVNGGKTLVLRENSSYSDGTNAGKFDLPGGRLKPGERFDEALRREVYEETGLNVSIGSPLAIGEWRPQVRGEQWQVVAIFFLCTADEFHVILSKDHDAFEWILPAEYAKYSLIDNLKPVFVQYLQQHFEGGKLEKP